MSKHIAVAGAGISGLATGVALQQRGFQVTIFEERNDTSAGTSITLWPNALAALDQLGLGDPVRAAGASVAMGGMRWRTGAWVHRPNAERAIDALGEPLVAIHRAALTEILTTGLHPDSVRHGVGVRNTTTTDDRVRLTLSDGTEIAADAAVGADGVRSRIAQELNGGLSFRYAGYTAWRGVATCQMDPGLTGVTFGKGAEFGHVPMSDRHTYWFVTERTPAGGKLAATDLPYLKNKYSSWTAPIPDVLAATDPADVVRHDIYDRSRADTWARGPVVVVGDAAHAMRPNIGQGGCQGLEDAAILAAFADGQSDLAAAFARFAAYRQPRVNALVRESAMAGRAFNLRPALLAAAVIRASALTPEGLYIRHMADVASRSAFKMPTADAIRS